MSLKFHSIAAKSSHRRISSGMRARGRPRQMMLDRMMTDGCGKLKEKTQLREEWWLWTF